MMEYIDDWHEQDKRRREQDNLRREQDKRLREQEELRRQRYERFKWLYWAAGAIVFFAGAAGWGLVIGDFLRALSQPRTVIIQMPPPASPNAAPTKP